MQIRLTVPGTGECLWFPVQVSFFRSNLFLSVVPKAKGKTKEGGDAQLEAIIAYIM